NSLSDLLVFGKRAGEHAAVFARGNRRGTIDGAGVQPAPEEALAPFDRQGRTENPYTIQTELQDMMQSLVGIVRTEAEMQQALGELAKLAARAGRAGGTRHRAHHTGSP